MSIKIEIKHKQLDSQVPLQIHYLPAKIDGDGEANVEKFFQIYTKTEKNRGSDHLTNSLRGFPLQGEKRSVPEGYKALVLQETHETLSEDANRVLKVTGGFENFYYWNYDKIPSKADAYIQALQLLEISKELASDLTEDEVLAEISRKKEKDIEKQN